LSKAGPGTLILNGVNDYTGTTSVNNGALQIGDADHADASILGAVTIGAEGKLEGHGTIGAMSPIAPRACSRLAAASAP